MSQAEGGSRLIIRPDAAVAAVGVKLHAQVLAARDHRRQRCAVAHVCHVERLVAQLVVRRAAVHAEAPQHRVRRQVDGRADVVAEVVAGLVADLLGVLLEPLDTPHGTKHNLEISFTRSKYQVCIKN